MSDAILSIKVEDDGAPVGGGTARADADAAERWRKLVETMDRTAADVARRSAARAVPPPPTTPPGAPAPAGRGWADLDFDARRKAALGGRPDGVSDREWEQFGAEGARRGREGARASGRAFEAAGRAREREQAARDAQAERDRKATEEQRKKAEAQKEKDAAAERADGHKRSLVGSAAGGAAGRYAGAAIGTAIAPGIGTAIGAVVGGVAGSFVGGRAVGKRDAEADKDAGFKGGAMGQIESVMGGVEKAFKFVGKAANEAGKAAEKVAGNDGFGAAQQGAELAAQGLEMIPVAGKAAAAGLRAVSEAVGAVVKASDAFVARGRELAGYNGSIAAAVAVQDTSRKLEDIREAQKFGGAYAKNIQARGEFDATFRGAAEPLKERLLDALPGWLERIENTGIGLLEGLNKIVPGTNLLQEMADAAKEARRRARAADAAAGEIFGDWLRAPAIGPPMPPIPVRGPDGRAPGGMEIPLIPPRRP